MICFALAVIISIYSGSLGTVMPSDILVLFYGMVNKVLKTNLNDRVLNAIYIYMCNIYICKIYVCNVPK